MWSLIEAPLRLLRRLRRRVLIHRRPLAALCVGLAVLLALRSTSPPPAETAQVWTAAHPLPAGAVLGSGDLALTEFAPASVPAHAVRDAREVLGRTLAAPMAQGEPLTRLRVVGGGLLRGYPGTTAVPLRITDADVVGLLRVGDEISVVVADPEGRTPPEELVADVPVVAIPRKGRALGDGTPGRLVVVAVPRDRAAEIAGRGSAGILIPVWSR